MRDAVAGFLLMAWWLACAFLVVVSLAALTSCSASGPTASTGGRCAWRSDAPGPVAAVCE